MAINIREILFGESNDPMFLKHGWDPSSGQYPLDPIDGQVYVVSNTASFGSPAITYSSGDLILFDGTSWIHVVNSAVGVPETIVTLERPAWDPTTQTFPDDPQYGQMYVVTADGSFGSPPTMYKEGDLILYSDTGWIKLETSSSGAASASKIKTWDVTPNYNAPTDPTVGASINGSYAANIFTPSFYAGGGAGVEVVASQVFTESRNLLTSGVRLALDLIDLDRVSDGHTVFVGVTTHPANVAADVGVGVLTSGTDMIAGFMFTGNVNTYTISRFVATAAAHVTGLAMTVPAYETEEQVQMYLGTVDHNADQLVAFGAVDPRDNSIDFLPLPSVDVAGLSVDTVYPFVAIRTANDSTTAPRLQVIFNAGDKRPVVSDYDSTSPTSLSQYELDVLGRADGFVKYGTEASYTQVGTFPAETATDDVLITTINPAFTGKWSDVQPLNHTVVRPNELVRVTGESTYEIVEEPTDLVGDWDVTPQFIPESVTTPTAVSSFNGAWDSGTSTWTPSFPGTGGVSTSAVIFDRTTDWNEDVTAIMRLGTATPAIASIAIIGWTTSPGTLESDMANLFLGGSISGTILGMVVGNVDGSANIAQSISNIGGTLSSGTLLTPPIDTDVDYSVYVGNQSESMLNYFAGLVQGATNDISTFNITGYAKPGTGHLFLGVLSAADNLPNQQTPIVQFGTVAFEQNPSITGTTAENQGRTQSQLDATHSGLFADVTTTPAHYVQVSTLPDGVRPGNFVRIINRYGAVVPAAPLGVSLDHGDLVQVSIEAGLDASLSASGIRRTINDSLGHKTYVQASADVSDTVATLPTLYTRARQHINDSGGSASIRIAESRGVVISSGNYLPIPQGSILDLNKLSIEIPTFPRKMGAPGVNLGANVVVRQTLGSSITGGLIRFEDDITVDDASYCRLYKKLEGLSFQFDDVGGSSPQTWIDLDSMVRSIPVDTNAATLEIEFVNCYFNAQSYMEFIKLPTTLSSTTVRLIFRGCSIQSFGGQFMRITGADGANGVLEIESYDSFLSGLRIDGTHNTIRQKVVSSTPDSNNTVDARGVRAGIGASCDKYYLDLDGVIKSTASTPATGFTLPIGTSIIEIRAARAGLARTLPANYFKDSTGTSVVADFYAGEECLLTGLTDGPVRKFQRYTQEILHNSTSITGSATNSLYENLETLGFLANGTIPTYAVTGSIGNGVNVFNTLGELFAAVGVPSEPTVIEMYVSDSYSAGTPVDLSHCILVGPPSLALAPTYHSNPILTLSGQITGIPQVLQNVHVRVSLTTSIPVDPVFYLLGNTTVRNIGSIPLFDLYGTMRVIVLGPNCVLSSSNSPICQTLAVGSDSHSIEVYDGASLRLHHDNPTSYVIVGASLAYNIEQTNKIPLLGSRFIDAIGISGGTKLNPFIVTPNSLWGSQTLDECLRDINMLQTLYQSSFSTTVPVIVDGWGGSRPAANDYITSADAYVGPQLTIQDSTVIINRGGIEVSASTFRGAVTLKHGPSAATSPMFTTSETVSYGGTTYRVFDFSSCDLTLVRESGGSGSPLIYFMEVSAGTPTSMWIKCKSLTTISEKSQVRSALFGFQASSTESIVLETQEPIDLGGLTIASNGGTPRFLVSYPSHEVRERSVIAAQTQYAGSTTEGGRGLGMPREITGTSYTVSVDDVILDLELQLSNVGEQTVTIDDTMDAGLPVGLCLPIRKMGVGDVVVSHSNDEIESAVNSFRIEQQYGRALARKITPDLWLLDGDLVRPHAAIYMNGNATATVVTEAETYYKLAGTTTTKFAKYFTVTDNRLTYIGKRPMKFDVTAGVCMILDQSNQQVRVRLAVNDVTMEDTDTCISLSVLGSPASDQAMSGATHMTHIFNPNDYVEVWGANWSSADDILAVNLHLIIKPHLH